MNKVKDMIEKSSISEYAIGQFLLKKCCPPGYYMKLVDNQTTGCAKDFWLISKDGLQRRRFEVKNDKGSSKWKRNYQELEKRNRYDPPDVWQPSGLTLAATQADYLGCLIYRELESYLVLFRPKILLPEVLAGPFEEKPTGANVNGNPDGSYSKGRVIPIEELKKFKAFVREWRTPELDYLLRV